MEPRRPELVEPKLTQRDLDQTPDDGNQYEVIDGILQVTPFPTYAHQNALAALFTLLSNHVRSRNLGKVFPAGLKVVLDEPTGVGPDIVYISTGRLVGMREDGFYGAPDLAVEIVSSKPLLDRVIKLQKYASAGIPHYWIIEPSKRQLFVHRLEGARYRLVTELESEATFEPELFPGLRVPLAELWS